MDGSIRPRFLRPHVSHSGMSAAFAMFAARGKRGEVASASLASPAQQSIHPGTKITRREPKLPPHRLPGRLILVRLLSIQADQFTVTLNVMLPVPALAAPAGAVPSVAVTVIVFVVAGAPVVMATSPLEASIVI
jgi:hypothetical protein